MMLFWLPPQAVPQKTCQGRFRNPCPCYPRVRHVAGVQQRKACRTLERMTGNEKRRIVCRHDNLKERAQIMASNLDWSQCPVVESIPGKVSGAWVFRDTRVPVSAIFENLKTSPIEEILENFHVTRDQVETVLDFAARSTQTPLEHLRAG